MPGLECGGSGKRVGPAAMLVRGPQDPASRCLRKLWLDSKLWLAILHLSVTSRELIRHLESDGWRRVRVKGSHHHFGHPTKKGIVTVRHRPETIQSYPQEHRTAVRDEAEVTDRGRRNGVLGCTLEGGPAHPRHISGLSGVRHLRRSC